MNKFLTVLFLLLFGFGSIVKAEFTPEQKKLQDEIVKFLKEEGFFPKIDSDNDIAFKSEGESFYITIAESDKNPMFIKLWQEYTFSETYNLADIKKCYAEISLNKGVKLVIFDDAYQYQGGMFVKDVEVFKYSFNKLLSQIRALKKDLADELDKL